LGETRVDLLHLLEDLRDAYAFGIEETILTEVIANSLDSGAQRIGISTSPTESTLTVVDDGSGMRRRDLARYHDVAASTKVRGHGIGFAGVGIKLGLLVAEEVITETRQTKTHVATRWHLSSRHRAPWKWIDPPGLVAERGTAVRLKLTSPLSPLLDPGFIEGAVNRHFRTLRDPFFRRFLDAHYPAGVRFEVNGAGLRTGDTDGADFAAIEVRLPRKRKPSGIGFLVRSAEPLAEGRRGIGISTLGKVIRQGWDWIGLSASDPDRISGLVEVPGLASCLTLNKADFIHSGSQRALYLAYRKAIQEAVSRQLTEWGEVRRPDDVTRHRAARPVEREVERVLLELSDEFPLLAALVEQRAGGQRRLPMGRPKEAVELPTYSGGRWSGEVDSEAIAVATEETGEAEPGSQGSPPGESPGPGDEGRIEGSGGSGPGTKSQEGSSPVVPGVRGPRRPAHYGLGIQFQERPDDSELARLLESTVSVNAAHPAYRRAVASRSEGYHIALSVAMALAPLAVEPPQVHGFVTVFLRHWGEALNGDRQRRRGHRRVTRRAERASQIG
jgi:hypothetical protein